MMFRRTKVVEKNVAAEQQDEEKTKQEEGQKLNRDEEQKQIDDGEHQIAESSNSLAASQLEVIPEEVTGSNQEAGISGEDDLRMQAIDGVSEKDYDFDNVHDDALSFWEEPAVWGNLLKTLNDAESTMKNWESLGADMTEFKDQVQLSDLQNAPDFVTVRFSEYATSMKNFIPSELGTDKEAREPEDFPVVSEDPKDSLMQTRVEIEARALALQQQKREHAESHDEDSHVVPDPMASLAEKYAVNARVANARAFRGFLDNILQNKEGEERRTLICEEAQKVSSPEAQTPLNQIFHLEKELIEETNKVYKERERIGASSAEMQDAEGRNKMKLEELRAVDKHEAAKWDALIVAQKKKALAAHQKQLTCKKKAQNTATKLENEIGGFLVAKEKSDVETTKLNLMKKIKELVEQRQKDNVLSSEENLKRLTEVAVEREDGSKTMIEKLEETYANCKSHVHTVDEQCVSLSQHLFAAMNQSEEERAEQIRQLANQSKTIQHELHESTSAARGRMTPREKLDRNKEKKDLQQRVQDLEKEKLALEEENKSCDPVAEELAILVETIYEVPSEVEDTAWASELKAKHEKLKDTAEQDMVEMYFPVHISETTERTPRGLPPLLETEDDVVMVDEPSYTMTKSEISELIRKAQMSVLNDKLPQMVKQLALTEEAAESSGGGGDGK